MSKYLDLRARHKRDGDRMAFAILLTSGATLAALVLTTPAAALLTTAVCAFAALATSPLWHSGVQL